jgi:hypothetical protein
VPASYARRSNEGPTKVPVLYISPGLPGPPPAPWAYALLTWLVSDCRGSSDTAGPSFVFWAWCCRFLWGSCWLFALALLWLHRMQGYPSRPHMLLSPFHIYSATQGTRPALGTLWVSEDVAVLGSAELDLCVSPFMFRLSAIANGLIWMGDILREVMRSRWWFRLDVLSPRLILHFISGVYEKGRCVCYF